MRHTTLMGFSAIAVITAIFSAAVSAHAAVIHTQWTIEAPTTPADLSNSAASPAVSASTGTGTLTGLHASSLTDWSTPVGNGSAESFSSNEWAIGDYYQAQTTTLGVGNVRLSWAQTRSSTGPSNFDLQWSTDGTNFTTATSYVVGTTSFSSGTFKPEVVFTADLSSVSALDNQANVYFRLTATSAPSSTGGTNRIDDFTVIVPEPASVTLMTLGGLALAWRRRRGAGSARARRN